MPHEPVRPVVPATIGGPAVPDILEEHLEELAFLGTQRKQIVFSPEVPLRRLADMDARIDAHWDGLVIAGASSAEVALTRLEDDNPWIVYAAARVWLEIGLPARAAVIERMAELPPEVQGGWREALRRCSLGRLVALFPPDEIPKLPAAVRAPVVDAFGWHGSLPPELRLKEGYEGPAEVRAAVARHLGTATADPHLPALLAQLTAAPEAPIRRAALWATALRNRPEALALCRAVISRGDTTAMAMLGWLGEASDVALLLGATGTPPARAAATRAVGDLGFLDAVGPLLGRLEAPEAPVAGAAAQALARILGSVPALEPALGADPEADEAPALDLAAVRKDVEARAGALAAGKRHWYGKALPWEGPPAEEPLAWVWRASLAAARPGAEWIRREVPSGLLDGALSEEARPGE